MIYFVSLFNKDLELPVMTVCKDKQHLAQLLSNLDDTKYELIEVTHTTADFVDNNNDFYKKPDEMEFGKGESHVNQ